MDRVNWKVIAELHKAGNVTRAADRLSMTQPALSKRLRIIEDELGVTLITRSNKGVRFTSEGEYLAGEAYKILAHFTEIREHLQSFKGQASGTIRLGMTNSFVRYTLPKHLKAYRASHSAVNFDVVACVSSQVVTKIEAGDIDVGLICGDLEGNFERAFIGKEHACLVNANRIELDELPETPQISYMSDPFAKKLVDTWWNGHFVKTPLIGLRANHGDTCLEMIANGLGYGIFLSPKFVDSSPKLFKMPLYHPDGAAVSRNLWMIWKPSASNIKIVSEFIDYMRINLGPMDEADQPAGVEIGRRRSPSQNIRQS